MTGLMTGPATGSAPEMRDWRPQPAFPEAAGRLLREGRAAFQGGARAEGLVLCRAACALDPSSYCQPWGLMPHLKAEGRDRLRQRMLDRLHSWYRPPHSRIHAHVSALTRKMEMQRYIAAAGLPLPEQYQQARGLEGLDWAALPERVVIKPENGASSKGVIALSEGWDHLAQVPVGASLRDYAETLYASNFDKPPGRVLAEELLEDVDRCRDPALALPRDFKIFTVAGHVAFVRVHDRNASDGKRGLATLDRMGRRLSPAQTGWPEAPPAPLPAGWDALIAMAEYLSSRLPWLLRLDFYLTPRGPVFGEFTTFPNAGLDYSPFGRRTVLQMWESWPD